MSSRFLAIVNPAAGGGRCGRLADAALERVRGAGIELDVVLTSRAGEAIELVRSAYQRGVRQFLAVGGDGTAFEVVNGLFPEALSGARPSLGFLPLGTGNSFLKDFTARGIEHTIEALKNGSRRACDVIRLRHSGGELYYLNLLSLGISCGCGRACESPIQELGAIWLYRGRFCAAGWPETCFVSASDWRFGRVGPARRAFSFIQQQQIYRRQYDDCAQGGRDRRADRIRALGADQPDGAGQDAAAAFYRDAYS